MTPDAEGFYMVAVIAGVILMMVLVAILVLA